MARSPSRDRSDRFTGFRNYVRDPDRFARWKTLALVSAGVLVGLWAVVEAAVPGASYHHTHGQLANPHAAWEHDCAACHRPQTGGFSFTNLFKAQDRWHDLTCTKCHAGPPHHATVKDTAFHEKCSNCHHDHGGRDASLTRITDDHCVRCHADLPAAHVAGATGFQNVTAFPGGHPEFAVLRDYPPGKNFDKRKLKFSHALHTTAGLGARWTVERIAQVSGPAAAERYREFSTLGGIALTCAACHQLDAGVATPADPDRGRFDRLTAFLKNEPRASLLPPRAEGAYYLPVNFEAHCQACHPLRAPDGTSGTAVVDGFALPHRVEGDDMLKLLRGGYAAGLARANPALAKTAAPGGRLDPPPAPKPAEVTFAGEVDRLTTQAVGRVQAGTAHACMKCHVDGGNGRVAPLPSHSVWFGHAKFNHVSHRGLTCAACHAGAGRPEELREPVNEVEPVSIAGADSCRACHAPAGMQVKQHDGTTATAAGVRHGCTDCHRYHNGDRPLHGMGSPHRDPAAPKGLAEFLRGGK